MVAPEVKELRLQVDALKQRLDFMAPMLSLLNFTQDYFQCVECEASVQLMRLKNAKIGCEATSDGALDEPTGKGAVETAKWLHTMTDIVMGLHLSGGGGCGSSSTASTATLAPQASPAVPQRTPGAAARLPPRAGQQASPRGLAPSAPLPEAERPFQQVTDFGASLAQSPSYAPTVATAPQLAGQPLPVLPATRGALASGGLPLRERDSLSPPAVATSPIGSSSPPAGPWRTLQAPPAETSIDNCSTLESGGLLLGRGMWANAYRQATGARREALTLLCATGIVTERELADDLTVISEDHIEECVSIASEMLQWWPPRSGPPPQRQAQEFFQRRLEELYRQRAPAPFGVH